MRNNRIEPRIEQAAPLDWLAKNLDALNDLVLTDLRRGGGNEEKLLTEFFCILRAKAAVRDGLAGLRELELGRAAA